MPFPSEQNQASPGEFVRRLPAEQLRDFSQDVLTRCGLSEADAAVAAEVLSLSDRRGIDSHGVARLWVYVKWLREGHANPRPRVRVIRETPSTLALHGDGGLGIVVGPRAHEMVLSKAAEVGSAWGTVSHSNHFGIAGYYALRAAQRQMIGGVWSNATAQMFPVGSVQPMLGTNPLAFALPAGEERPVVIDMATSTAAFGRIEIAEREGRELPVGWLVDERGESIRDPARVRTEPHALSPLGAIPEHGVHKGYCLAALADLLAGVLSGAAFGPHCPHFFFPEHPASDQTQRGLGHCFTAIQVAALAEPSEFASRMDEWIRKFRSTAALDPQRPVQVPGDIEWRAYDERQAKGIPLLPAVVQQLRQIARETGADWPFSEAGL